VDLKRSESETKLDGTEAAEVSCSVEGGLLGGVW